MKCCIWSVALYGAENWTLRKIDQKYPERFEMWCWRGMEEISWISRMKDIESRRREGGRYAGLITSRLSTEL